MITRIVNGKPFLVYPPSLRREVPVPLNPTRVDVLGLLRDIANDYKKAMSQQALTYDDLSNEPPAAELLGRRAFYNDLDVSCNPYRADSIRGQQWRSGWQAALKAATEECPF